MAEYRQVSNETENLFNQTLDNTSIPNWVEFKVLANDNLKELYQVRKLSDLFEYLAEGTNIAIIINEEIFEQLPDFLQKLVLEEALSGVVVDENDKIKLNAFDFNTYSGLLEKHGPDEIIKLKESIISLFTAKQEKEEEEKEARKQARKKKNKE